MIKMINKENCFDNQSFDGNVGANVPCLNGRQVPRKKLRSSNSKSLPFLYIFFSTSNI